MKEYIVKNLEEMQSAAEDVLHTIEGHTQSKKALIVGLYGNLGAGKTTFVQCVARALGVKETVTSPTFVIMKVYDISYKIFTKLFHIDAYRLKDGQDLDLLGWNEVQQNPENIIFIEWPLKVKGALPENIISITFTNIDEKTRKLEVKTSHA